MHLTLKGKAKQFSVFWENGNMEIDVLGIYGNETLKLYMKDADCMKNPKREYFVL